MNLISKILCPILSINLILPVSVFAQSQNNIENQARKAEKAGIHAVLELKKAGTEFYLDTEKKNATDLTNLRPNKNGSIRFYTITPYDRQLNTRVAVAQTIQIRKNGQIGMTVEILKNEPKKLTSYPIRAIKSIEFGKTDACSVRIQFTRTIQAALAIAQNQMNLGKKESGKMEKFATSLSNFLMPSATAGVITKTVSIITGAFGAGMLIIGGWMFIGGIGFLLDKRADISDSINFIFGSLTLIGGAALSYVAVDFWRK